MDENEQKLDGQDNEELNENTLLETKLEEDLEISEDSEDSEGSDESLEEKSPDSEKEEDEDKINQASVQKKINKVIREKKEAEEKTVAETQKREELEAKIKALEKTTLPEIPTVPDYMDPDYVKKLEARDAIIIKHAQEASHKQMLEQANFAQAKVVQEANQAKIQQTIVNFDEKIAELKLDKQDLINGQNVVGSYIKGKQELATFLLEESPLNVLYLSQNLEEMEKVSKMSETKAAVYIATTIAPKAQELKPKTTNAPNPSYNSRGNRRVSKGKDPNEGNATYE